MELTRRDALAALGAAGLAGGGAALLSKEEAEASPGLDTGTLVALARVLYPSEVSGVPEFVETYALGRTEDRPEYRDGMADALAELDDFAESWYGGRFVDLDAETQDSLLREIGLGTADPEPDGRPPERIRYYLVNDLLYALYASPTGGKLVGIENPQGYPGGTDSYRRGPR